MWAEFNKAPLSLKSQAHFISFVSLFWIYTFVVYTFSRQNWSRKWRRRRRRRSNWENGCIGANYCIVAWLWLRFSRRNSRRLQRWWCHRRRLAGGVAGGSFLRCCVFSCVVVKEMSSEQNPVWQLRVKWAEKSKSHPSCEHLIFTVAPLRAGIGS